MLKSKKVKKIVKIKKEKPLKKIELQELIKEEDYTHFYHVVDLMSQERIEKLLNYYLENKKDASIFITNFFESVKSSKEIKIKIEELAKKKINEEYQNLKSKIQTLRKKGGDTRIEEIESMSIPLKIKMYEATQDKKDYLRVNKKIEHITLSIDQKLRNIKKTD